MLIQNSDSFLFFTIKIVITFNFPMRKFDTFMLATASDI